MYNGDRVLEETDGPGTTVLSRYTTVSPSYFGPLLHQWRPSGSLSRFPLYDGTGSARGLADASGTVTDTYTLDAFGVKMASDSGSTPNPYHYDGAWGYITDPSAFQQLGYRFYWPELGRFLQQDPIGDGMNWYAYVGNNPVTGADPAGLDVVIGPKDRPWLVFDSGSIQQLKMSAKATAGGLVTGFTAGAWSPNWNDPCDQYAGFSRTMGIGSGVVLLAAATGGAGAEAAAGEEAATPVARIYGERVFERMAEVGAKDLGHNFPLLVDDMIFEQGARTVVSENYILYEAAGVLNDTQGIYQIGVRPLGGGAEEIVHRLFIGQFPWVR